jgi:hypothetical protein
MLKAKLIITLSFLFTGCTSYSPPAPIIEDINSPVLKGAPIIESKNPVTNFNNQLISMGINLMPDEANLIRSYISAKPNGSWDFSDESTAKETLKNNFNDFRKTFEPNGPVTENDYMVKALDFATSNNFYAKLYFDSQYFQKKHKILVVKGDTQTKEFIIIHINGRVSNYQLTANIGPPRYISIPESY